MWLILFLVVAVYFIDFGSETTNSLAIFSASLFAGLLIYKRIKRNALNLPPGPIGLPLLGYMPFLGNEPHKSILNLAKKYGNIFSMNLGPQYTVMVTQYDAAKEILTHPAALARPPNIFDLIPGKGGFSASNGEEWQEHRRFCMQAMRDLGLGKGPWETLIQADASDLVEEVAGYNGKPIDIHPLLCVSQSNNTISLLTGKRMVKGEDDEEREIVKKTLEILMEYVAPSSVGVIAPWLIKYLVLFRIGGYHIAASVLKDFEGIFRKRLALRKKSKDDVNSHDFIGLWMQEMEKMKSSRKSIYFTEEVLFGQMVLLFLGGTEALIASLVWLFLIMSSRPEVQKKVQEEIDDVIGRDGIPYWDERYQFPYTVAVIMEMERYMSITPLPPPRYALEDFKIRDYTIPKGATIVINNWAIMHDPKYFKDPEEFMPERFLKATSKKELMKPEGYNVFSVGKRNCPGESIAMMTIFLYFTSMMQKFTVKTPTGEKANMKEIFGAVLHPVPQKLCFYER